MQRKLGNITGNSSNKVNQSVFDKNLACMEDTVKSGIPKNPFEDFYKAAFGSSIYMFVVSIITVLANSLLLLILYIDPLKIFRNPTTYFLIGLAIVDLLTGLVQESIYATCFVFLYLNHPLRPKCRPYMQFAYYFASFTITVSLIIVFTFTVTQYIVVASPLKYGRLVTKKKVLVCVVFIYLYTAIMSCLPLMGVSLMAHDAITLFLHSYALVVVTLIFYILLHYAMKSKMAAGNSLGNENTSREESKHVQVQRSFVRVNVILHIVLIVCFVPTIIIMTIRLFMKDEYAPSAQTVQIANLMIDNVHYLKFLLDPFVYSWRMPKYRESLRKIFCRQSIRKQSGRSGSESRSVVESHSSELATEELNKSAITLHSFKNIPTD